MIKTKYITSIELKKQLYKINPETKTYKYCIFIDNFVERYFSKNKEETKIKNKGRPPYNTKAMLKIWIMGYSEGIRSGRKLEELLHHHDCYKHLANNIKPCYKTLINFKNKNHKLIKNIFNETIQTALHNNLLQLDYLAIDGTKIRANASKTKSLRPVDIQFLKYIFNKRKLKEIMHKKEKYTKIPKNKTHQKLINQLMDFLYKTKDQNNAKKDETDRKIRKGLINYYQNAIKSINHLKKAKIKLKILRETIDKTKQTSISTTDHESRWMLNKNGGKDFNYNIQTGIDTKSQIILSIDAIQHPTDITSLIPQIKQIEQNITINKEHTIILADNGYYQEKTLDYLEQNKFKSLIPNRQQASKSKTQNQKNKPFGKAQFQYNPKNNTYTCPNNKILPMKTEKYIDGKSRQIFYTNDCKLCQYQIPCAGKNQYKTITDYTSATRRKQEQAFENDKENKKYKNRNTVETTFANILKNYEYHQTNTHGLQNIKTEMNLQATAINLKKIFNKLTTKQIT